MLLHSRSSQYRHVRSLCLIICITVTSTPSINLQVVLTFSINFVQSAGILLETLEHVGLHVTKPMMRQPSYYVPCLSGGNSPALAFPIVISFLIVISIYRSCQGAEPNVTIYTFFSTPTTPIEDSVGDGGVSDIRRFWPLDLHLTAVR